MINLLYEMMHNANKTTQTNEQKDQNNFIDIVRFNGTQLKERYPKICIQCLKSS